MDNRQRIPDVLEYWFGELDARGLCAQQRNRLWFQSSDDADAAIRERFGATVEAALQGQFDHWADSKPGLVALVVLLDQFTRNIYRGTPRAFSGDSKALQLAKTAVANGDDISLPVIHRVFLYMPYEHSEDLADQDAGVSCFERLLAECGEQARDEVESFSRYMLAHREVIARFGRFPHRNTTLGRTSSTAELAHLETHGGF